MLFLSFLNKETTSLFLPCKLTRNLNSMVKGTKKCHVQRMEIYFQQKPFKTIITKLFLDKIKLTKTKI